MKNNQVINLGFIGTGIAANQLHWPALEKLTDRFKVYGVSNRTRQKAEAFAKLTHATIIYDDAPQLILDENIDAVIIAAPIESNYDFVCQAIAANKHVFVEKPLASKLSDAYKLVELERKYTKATFLAENFRYHAAFHDIARSIHEGKIGKVISFTWNSFNKLVPGDKYATQWRLNNQYPGGYVMDGGIHNVAAIRLIFGELKESYSKTCSINPEIGTIDTLISTFALQSGVVGQLNMCFSTKGYSENKFFILGEKGIITFEDNIVSINAEKGKIFMKKYEFRDSYYNEFLDFYAAIQTENNALSSFEEGARDLEFMYKLLNES